MEEKAAPSGEAPKPAPKGKGLWIGIAVVVVVVVVLLGLVLGGYFNPPARPDLPEAVYFVGYPEEGKKIIPEWHVNRAQWPVKWLFSEGVKTQSFIDDLEADNVDTSTFEGTAPAAPTSTSYQQAYALFRDRYFENFSKEPNLFDPHSYDATFVIALAMHKANSVDTNSTAFKQALRDVANPPGTAIRPGEWALALTEIAAGREIDYQGASGAVNFDSAGEVGSDYEVWRVNATGGIERKQFIPEGSWLTASAVGAAPPAEPRQLNPIIGTILPITGSLAAFGSDMQNSTDLARNHINAQGGIRGDTLSLVHDDDATSQITGADAARAQINTDGVHAIVGSAASSVSLSVFAVAGPSGILMVSPASTSPVFTTSDTTDLFWRTAPSDALQGKAAGYYAYTVAGYRKVSVIYVNNAYGVGLATVFEQDFEARGGQIYRSVSFELAQASYTSVVNALFTSGPAAAAVLVAAAWRPRSD